MEQKTSTENITICAEYELLRPRYECLVEEICFVLKKKLNSKDESIASISGRVKTIDSLLAKIERKNYADPLQAITDLAAVRVVCNYEFDLHQIVDLIESMFDVRERVDKSHELGVAKMGYNGLHFIVSLGGKYAGARYEQITTLKCEIQVRTVLQDAWALISHHLVYKDEAMVPKRLHRDLNNVASLLEIAQGVFDSVKEKRDRYRLEIVSREPNPDTFLSQPVDFETLIAYTKWKFPELFVSEQLSLLLLQDMDIAAYPTLAQIDFAIKRAKRAVDAYRLENPDWFKSGSDFITKSLGFVDPKFRAKHAFAQKTLDAFERYQHLLPPR